MTFVSFLSTPDWAQEPQTNQDSGPVYQDTYSVLLKTVKVINNNETLRDWYSPEEFRGTGQRNKISILDWILEQKKDIKEKRVKSNMWSSTDTHVPMLVP